MLLVILRVAGNLLRLGQTRFSHTRRVLKGVHSMTNATQHSKQLMGALILGTLIGIGYGTSGFAHGGGAAGGGHVDGMAAAHISDAGSRNTNGPLSADRDKGLDRATRPMSEHGLAHE